MNLYCLKTETETMFVNDRDIHYIKVSPSSGCNVVATKENAQGVVIYGTPHSINADNPIANIAVATLTEQANWDEEIQAEYTAYLTDKARSTKIPELTTACDTAINNGTTVILSTGEENFTYNLADQSNISEMFNAVAMGATSYPYHENEELCKVYSAQDIVTLYATLSGFKTAQTTYFNQLKAYVNSLTTPDEVYAVEYGQELTGEYLENYNTMMGVAQEALNAVLGNLTQKMNMQ